MGHLLEAIKKLDAQRTAVRCDEAPSKTVLRPATVTAAVIRRIDRPHLAVAAPHVAELAAAAESTKSTSDVEPTKPLAVSDAPAATQKPATRCQFDAATIWRFDPPRPPAEYHPLAAQLTAGGPGLQTLRSILLVSATHASLGTVSPAALATVLAVQGKVAWIDTEHDRPLPSAIGPEPGTTPGWHDLLRARATWQQILAATSIPNVAFAGRGTAGWDERQKSLSKTLLEPLHGQFEFLLVNGHLVNDAAPLAWMCDTVGLVVAIGHDKQSQVERALRAIATSGGPPPVLIAVEPPRARLALLITKVSTDSSGLEIARAFDREGPIPRSR